jgi:hypothetical protein
MPHTQTHITLLIDQTASMFPYATQVVDGLNHYVDALCAQTPGPAFATLKTFAETVTTHYAKRPIHRVDKIRLETYVPAGNTALYDAIETTLETLSTAPEVRQMVVILSVQILCLSAGSLSGPLLVSFFSIYSQPFHHGGESP